MSTRGLPHANQEIFRVAMHGARVHILLWSWDCSGKHQKESGMREVTFAFPSVDSLPEWMARKLAVLSMLDPTKNHEEIPGIGRRVSQHVYWVYPEPEMKGKAGEMFGKHTRSVGKAPRA